MQYSDVQTFTYLEKTETVGLVVKASGGNLVIAAKSGNDYITADTINADLVTEYFVKGLTLRFTPSGGCTFSIRGGD